MPTLNIGIDSTAATTGGRNIRAELQKINKEAKHTIILLSQMGKIQSWRQVKTQLDSMGKSSVKNFNDLQLGLRGAKKDLDNFRISMKKHNDHINDTVNTMGQASKQMNQFGTATKKSTSLINTWVGKYSIVMSGLAASIFVFQNVFLAMRKMVQMFKEFNDALGKLKLKLVGDDLKNAQKAMLDFQASTRFSVTDFANGMDAMMQYGATAKQAMENVGKMTQFATITQQKFGTATREMISILKQHHLSIEEINTAFAIYAAKNSLISSDMEYMSNLVENKLSVAFGKLGGTLKSITVEQTADTINGIAVAIDKLAETIDHNQKGIFWFFKNWAKVILYGSGFGTVAKVAELLSDIGKKAEKKGEIPGKILPTPSAWIRPDMTQSHRKEVLARMYGGEIDAILQFEQEKMKIQADMIEEQIKADDKAFKEKERALKELERLNDQYLKEQLRTETSDIKERVREEKAVKREEDRYMKEQIRHEERMIIDRLRAYQSLYRDMQNMRKHNFDFERQVLQDEYNEYVRIFGREIPELLEWFSWKQREILKRQLEEEGGFFGGIRAAMMDMADDIKHFGQEWGKFGREAFEGLTESFENSFVAIFKGKLDDLKDVWKNFTQSLLDSFIKILAKMATQALVAPIIVPFFGEMMGTGGTAMAANALGLPTNAVTSGLGSSLFGKLGSIGGGIKDMLGGFMGTSWLDAKLGLAGGLNNLGAEKLANWLVGMKSNLFGGMMGGIGGLLTGITTGNWAKGGGQAIGSILGGLTPLGPLGAIAGGMIGNLLGGALGPKPHRMRGKGFGTAEGSLLDFIDIDTRGWGKHGVKKGDVQKALQSSLEAVRDQYESIFTALPLEYKTAFVEEFKWAGDFYAKGSKDHFEKRLKKAIQKLSKDFDKSIQSYLTKQVKSYGKTQLDTMSKSAGFAILAKDSPVMQMYDQLVSIFNQSGNWNAAEMQKYMDAISELEGYIHDIADAVKNAFKDVKDTIARFELTDVGYELYKLQQWYDEQIETWESLKGILTQDQLNQHLNDINKAFEYLRQEIFDNFIDPLQQFFDELDLSDLAPVQSLASYQSRLQELMEAAGSGNAADLQALMDFVKSTYLPFMKAYGEGDYKDIYNQLIDTLREMFEKFKADMGSYQHGTPYVPKTGLYQLHEGEAVVPAGHNAPQEMHIHLEVDGRQIGYVIAKDMRSNGELVNAIRRAVH